jgi:hypothetical protein
VTGQGNGKDRRAERAELMQRLGRLPARARLDALLQAHDAPALVRALPAEQLYATIAEVGLADATELVQLASPEQFQSLVDLGAWRKDRLDSHGLLEWLRAARGDSPEEALPKLHGIDLELLELMVRELTIIHDLEETPDPPTEGVTIDSADGHFRIEFKVEGGEQAGLRALLFDLMGEDPLGFSRFIEAVRWELPTELEEIALRFRWGRLADLGFPDPESAAGLYSSVPVRWPPAEPAAETALARIGAPRPDYVQIALDGLRPTERQTAEEELRGVYNAALVADGADPGDLDAFRSAAERARDTLGLGLEHETGGEPARAVDVVRDVPIRRLFQVGFSLGLRLKHRADRLASRPLARVDGQWMVWPDLANVLGALRRSRPLHALPVEGAEPVPFRSIREIRETEQQLGRAERQQALFAALLGGTEADARRTLDGLGPSWPAGGTPAVLAAALAHALLERVPRVAPLAASRTQEFGRAFLTPGTPPTVRLAAVGRAGAILHTLVPAAGDEAAALAQLGLETLADALGGALLAGPLPATVQTTLPLLPGL